MENVKNYCTLLSYQFNLTESEKEQLFYLIKFSEIDGVFKIRKILNQIPVEVRKSYVHFRQILMSLRNRSLILPLAKGEYILNKKYFGNNQIKDCKKIIVQYILDGGETNMLLKFD